MINRNVKANPFSFALNVNIRVSEALQSRLALIICMWSIVCVTDTRRFNLLCW